MKLHSQLPVSQYLQSMKTQMGSFFEFGSERFVGTIVWRFFSVTYCSGHEMNRRITNEKSRAIGFAWPAADGGTIVRCVRLKGMSNPVSLLISFLLFYLMFSMSVDINAVEFEIWPFALAGSILLAVITAVQDSVTERGQEGSHILTSFLHDPNHYYTDIH